MQLQRVDLAGLTTRIAGPADAAVTVVLLHGFGAPGDDLVDLARALPAARCVFPEAPLALAGVYGDARAWWLLDLASLDRPRDRRGELPDGLAAARAQVSALLDALASSSAASRRARCSRSTSRSTAIGRPTRSRSSPAR